MAAEISVPDLKNKIVLMYHDIYRDSVGESGFQTVGSNYYKIREEQFIRHIKFIKTAGLEDKVVFTFDDGGVSFYDVAAPILEQNGLRGVVCVPTDYVGVSGFLNWMQIEELCGRGHIIASHSSSHPGNMCAQDRKSNVQEWVNSIRLLNSILGYSIDTVSVPNGYYSDFDIDTIKSLCIRIMYISTPGFYRKSESLQIVGRIAISSSTSMTQFKRILNFPLYRKYLAFKQQFLDLFKQVFGDTLYKQIKLFLRNIF